MNTLISVKDLSVKYDAGFVVENVSFDVYDGDYLCIVGENGSGKSTLMKAILGLVKPSGGSTSFHGLKQSQIGFIPQQTVVQKDFPTSVWEVILSGCMNKQGILPFYTRRNKMLTKNNIIRLGAQSLIHKSYRELSGGQQQRVLLARALCATEKILLLDEPVTGLDPVITNELYGLLDMLNKQGITIVMISHDITSAVKYACKVLHMQTTTLFYGDKNDYLASPVFKKMNGGDKDD